MTKNIVELRFLVMHNRIARLAQLAIDRKQIKSCVRILGTDNYSLVLSSGSELFPETCTGVHTGTLLYLLNSQYNAQNPSESSPENSLN